MAKYVKKPVEIEAITFDELMRIGAENADTVVNGMPVKFMYNGYVIRQYDSNSYTIPTLEGDFLMTKDDMLITWRKWRNLIHARKKFLKKLMKSVLKNP